MGTLLGLFLSKLLSIAGLGGLIAGLFIRHWPVAVGAGLAFGVIDSLVLASMRYLGLVPIEWIMAILVGVLAAILGWWFRWQKRA